METSWGNKVLLGLLLTVLLTWGARTYFYTRHLKTDAQVEDAVKAVRMEEAVKRSEIMVQKGEAYSQIRALQSQLNTLKTSRGSKKILPDGTIIEDWENEESSSLVEKATSELREEMTELSQQLESTEEKLSEATDSQHKLKQSYDELVLEKASMQKRATLLLGAELGNGTWQERIRVGTLLHLGVFSAGVTTSPSGAIEEATKAVDQREENGWLKALHPTVWGGWSF